MPLDAALLPPPDVTPACPHFGICGGCSLQVISYSRQVAYKEHGIQALFQSVANPKTQFLPFLASSSSFPKYYRNKTRFSFIRKQGVVLAARHNIVPGEADFPVESCVLQSELSTDIAHTVARLATTYNWDLFDKERGTGWLKHLLIREGKHTGECMACIVTTDIPEDMSRFVEDLTSGFPRLTSLWHIVTKGRSNDDTHDTLLYGSPFIRESLSGMTLRISPHAFFQPNSEMMLPLYTAVRERVAESNPALVWDLYAGSATIGMFVHDTCTEVVSVEREPANIEDAEWNLAENGIPNIRTVSGDVELFSDAKHPDCIIVDPPRTGLTSQALQLVLNAKPSRIVYVSCGPETCVRDAQQILAGGYSLSLVQGVDMFPHTLHSEVIATFERI